MCSTKTGKEFNLATAFNFTHFYGPKNKTKSVLSLVITSSSSYPSFYLSYCPDPGQCRQFPTPGLGHSAVKLSPSCEGRP